MSTSEKTEEEITEELVDNAYKAFEACLKRLPVDAQLRVLGAGLGLIGSEILRMREGATEEKEEKK
jgi:hypothetical protein